VSSALVLAVGAAVAAAVGVVDLAATSVARSRKGEGRVRRRGRFVALCARIGRRAGAPAVGGPDLAGRIAAAGTPLGLGVADVMAAKGGGALVALLAGAPIAAALPGRLPLPAALACPLAGFYAPDLWLARRIRIRGRVMEAELPDLLDLLRVAVAAGLPVMRAMGEVGRRHGGLLAGEWRRAAAEIELGVPGTQALHRLAARCPPAGMAALVAALDRTQRHGAPVTETLSAQAREARAARARRIRDQAARASPKIQLVVALLLVPSVLLLVAAALAGSLVDRAT
jgi:tight adherence protein C